IPLACLLPGEFNRRGQLARALLAIVIAFVFELLEIGVSDLAARSAAAIPLMYATDLLPFVLVFAILLRGNIRLGFRLTGVAGVSVWQCLTPAMLVAMLVGIIAVTVFNPAASLMEAAYEKLESRILRQASDQPSLSDSGLWLRQSDQAGNQIIIHGVKLAPG